ncbi:MAG: imidazolonepropionase, partial [Chlamydiota bacterium]
MNDLVKLFGPFNQIVTMANVAKDGPINDSQLEIIEDGGIRVNNGQIIEVGNYASIKQSGDQLCEVSEEAVAIPGFIDAHTHMCWAGNRAHDYAYRLQGATYQEIAARGGGILDTVRHTRAATKQELSTRLEQNVLKHVQRGVTTMEIKSGYALNIDDEIKMLEVIREINSKISPTLIPTCLAAHTRPPEFDNNKDYLELLKKDLLPTIQERDLCNRVDIFIEKGAFESEESEEYLSYAQKLGFTICAHVDQFNLGGSAVAAKIHALTADHLEVTTADECALLKQSDVIPVVLPGASMGLGMPFAPARMLLDHGLALVIASDWNPGSAPQGELLTQASILGATEKLTIAETLAALTTRASRALLLEDRGTLESNKRADFLVF